MVRQHPASLLRSMTTSFQTQGRSFWKKRIKKINLNKLRFLGVSRFHHHHHQLKENFMNSLIFRSDHGVKSVSDQKVFKVSTNISLRRSQATFN